VNLQIVVANSTAEFFDPTGSLPLARRFRRFSRDVANLAFRMGEGGRSDVVSNFAHALHACAFNQRSTLVGELETSDISWASKANDRISHRTEYWDVKDFSDSDFIQNGKSG
jgi:hypothetical protein